MRKTTIELTKDMAENLVEYFDVFAKEDVVSIELNDLGLWWLDGANNPLFLGKARADNTSINIIKN